VSEHEAIGAPRPDRMQDAANRRLGPDLDALDTHVTSPRPPDVGGRDATRRVKATQGPKPSASALKLTIPPSLPLRADEIVQ
jgi:hypothetical protein